MYTQLSKRWGEQKQDVDSIDLLAKKDQQIRKLQAEVQQQRRKAQNAMKMLQSYKTMNNQSQHSSEGLRSEMSRRMRAQQEVKRLKKRNEQLEAGIKQIMKNMQQKLIEKKEKQLTIQNI